MSLVLDAIRLTIGAETLIHDVSIELARGTMNVLLGPTLAGKTTLMRLMAGLDKPTSGRVLIDGRDVTGMAVRKRSVAMVYQQFVNYPNLSVYENIASPLRVGGLDRAEIEARVQQATKLLRLDGMLQRMPAQLSGGQQQRTAIARALVQARRTRAAGRAARQSGLQAARGVARGTAAHLRRGRLDPRLCHHRTHRGAAARRQHATLWQGRVTQVGPTAAVFRRPENIDAARVFSDPPLNELPVRNVARCCGSATAR